MVSRRRFLQTGSLAAGVSVVLPTLAQAAEGDRPLPPAIAALRTLRGEGKPITAEERAGRQEKARRLPSCSPRAHPLPTSRAYAGRVENASLPWCCPPRAKRFTCL